MDILDIKGEMKESHNFNRHYCFFESVVYLRESVVSLYDKNVLASLAILRPFLELSVFHIYWYLRCHDDTYEAYYKWIDSGKTKVSYSKAMKFIFQQLPAKTPGRVDIQSNRVTIDAT